MTAIKPCGRSSRRSELLFVARREPELRDVEQSAVARQQADDRGFAVLGRHGGDAEVDLGPRKAQARRAVLRQAAFRDVETGENLDARNERLREHVSGRSRRAQKTIHPHAHRQPVAKRFDVNVAGAQLHRLFHQVVDSAYDRRPAGEVPQIVDVLFRAADVASLNAARSRIIGVEPVAEQRRDVFERSYDDFKRAAKDEFRGLQRFSIRWIANRKRRFSVVGLEWKYLRLPQKPPRKAVGQRASFREFGKRQTTQAKKARDFVRKFVRR